MKNIKFSHQYTKMPEGWNKPHLLLEVFKVNYKDLSEVFIDYDTGNFQSKGNRCAVQVEVL